jgi:hypothetical protein
VGAVGLEVRIQNPEYRMVIAHRNSNAPGIKLSNIIYANLTFLYYEKELVTANPSAF